MQPALFMASACVMRIGQRHAVFPGSGSYFTASGDTLVSGGTTAITVVVTLTATDYTPAAEQVIVSKWDGPSNQRQWYLSNNSAANGPRFQSSTDGTTALASPTTGASGFTDGTQHRVRYRLTPDDGLSRRNHAHWEWDGTAWVLINQFNTAGATTIVTTSSAPLTIGALNTSASPWIGSMKRLEVFNGTSELSTRIVDFNPNDYSGSGTSWKSATTSETWTMVGSASVVYDT